MRKIKITFETISKKSARNNEAAERGWINEEGVEIIPDEYDIEDHGDESKAAIELAIMEIGGAVPSSSEWSKGVWYTDADPDRDTTTGDETFQSYHLEGFTEAEELAIFEQLK